MLKLQNKEEVQELIAQRNLLGLRHLLAECEPNEVAHLIDGLPVQDDIITFRLLPNNLATETFQHLSYDKQQQLIKELGADKTRLSNLLNDLDPDDRTALLEEMPGPMAQRLIQSLSAEERKVATELLGYPKESIGRLMTPDYVAVRPEFTIQQTLEHIRQYGKDSETLSVIYVIDEKWKLIDDLRVREIILAKPEQSVLELMDNRFVSLKAMDDQETAVRVFRDYDRSALPVTDRSGILLGIVTVDDVLDIAEEEATEDFHKFGSIQDAIFNPLKAKVGFLYRKRIIWLFALVFMNIFSGAAMATYEETIQAVVSLVFFLPLLIDSGGNAGAQSATLMIRAMATGDVHMKDWFKLVGKEMLVALLLGLTMAAAVALVASYRSPEIIIIVALTMICIVLVGSVLGMSLPFIFTKFGVDPATASAPLITSVADICGVLIYLSIATWYLGMSG
ncbi:MAG: magnesium transporter [Bacteroidota bacterium]|nr:magnesium transporter [Bacteroidota bacterium]